MANPLSKHWTLDPDFTFLNHGSFGACPKVVLEAQAGLRAHLEAEPVRFFMRELEEALDHARHALATFVKADPEGMVFVRNATEGVNTVLARYPLKPGDALLTTDHAYAACKNALDDLAERTGAEVIVAKVPFPIKGAYQVVEAIEAAVTPRVKLALLDHITSPTGLVFPIPEIVQKLEGHGIACLVDGAHAPGMIDLDVNAIGASYYTGNCHKWLCAPKGAAFLWARADKRATLRPLSISHGANSTRTDRSKLRLEFDFTGTHDPTAHLCVPVAIDAIAAMVPGGWPAVRAHNHALVIAGRDMIIAGIGGEAPAPDEMLGSLATIMLPDAKPGDEPGKFIFQPLGDRLYHQHKIEVPVISWPHPPRRQVRIAAQLYNDLAGYGRLRDALVSGL